jgi:hypothetical protein
MQNLVLCRVKLFVLVCLQRYTYIFHGWYFGYMCSGGQCVDCVVVYFLLTICGETNNVYIHTTVLMVNILHTADSVYFHT